MRYFAFLALFFGYVFANININEATRYELMTLGGLDAGRADMILKYRENRSITSQNELRAVNGFRDYNISLLAENFEFGELKKSKDESKKVIVKEVEKPIRVIEKTKIIRENPRYIKKSQYGDITIIESGTYPRYKDGYRYDKFHHHDHRYNQSFDYGDNGGISINGSVNFRREINF